MPRFLDIVQQEAIMDEDKLCALCAQKNVWDYFGIEKDAFLDLSDAKKIQLTKKFCFENVKHSTPSINLSIGNAVQNSSGINLTKITENNGVRTEMSLLTNTSERKPKSVLKWKDFGFFDSEICEFNIEKVNMPENTLFYVNQGYQSYKDNKKVYYNDIFIIAQIMPVAHQPKDIESYVLNNGEVKILRSRYDPVSGEFLGIEYCIAVITVRNDPEEQFFDYGYSKDNSKTLYSTRKVKIPSSFKSTVFGIYKNKYEGGAFSDELSSRIFFYLPSTVDRNEKIMKHLTSVYLKPFNVNHESIGENFDPSSNDFDRQSVISYMKTVAEQSSQNLKRNADAFLSTFKQDNEKLLWPGGKRTKSEKFALTY